MTSLIHEQFAVYDYEKFPVVGSYRDGKAHCDKKLLISPYTTGEPIFVLKTTYYANPDMRRLSADGLDAYAHAHKYAEEIMIFEDEAEAVIDGVMYNIPANGMLVAKAGCRHAAQFVDPGKGCTVTSVFIPTVPASEDPDYVLLIQRTKEYLAGEDVVRL